MGKTESDNEGIAVRVVYRGEELGTVTLPSLPPPGYLLELSNGIRCLVLNGILSKDGVCSVVVQALPPDIQLSSEEIARIAAQDHLSRVHELIVLRDASHRSIEEGFQSLVGAEDD